MNAQRQLEREEKRICDDFNRGVISREQYNEEMRDLEREYRAMAQEAAQQAYERELDNW